METEVCKLKTQLYARFYALDNSYFEIFLRSATRPDIIRSYFFEFLKLKIKTLFYTNFNFIKMYICYSCLYNTKTQLNIIRKTEFFLNS